MTKKEWLKLTPQQKADLILLKKGRTVAKFLGHGYRVVGAGPGVLFSSSEFSRHPLDMPAQLVEYLYDIALDTP